MKSLVRMMLAVVMVLSVGMTCMAAPSVSAQYEVSGATDSSGSELSVEVMAPTKTLTADQAVELLKAAGEDIASSKNIAVIIQDVVAPSGAKFPLNVTLDVKGVTASSKVYILYYNGSAWEPIAATAGNNTVSFVAKSSSPVAVIVEGATVVSPKTGVNGVLVPVIILVVAAVMLVLSFRKKTV